MSASARLRAKLDLAYPAARAESERVWTSTYLRELYPVYLATLHGIVRSAVPLMQAALQEARARADGDEVAAGLVPYFEHHAPEEDGHAGWLLEDLEELGIAREPVLAQMPSPAVAALVGAQYYWLRHHHPVSLLGHMAFVEGYPPQPGFSERLRELTGYPREAFRAIRRHERLDIRHRRELHEAIDALPLTREHETIVGVSALHTVRGAIDVFAQIAAAVPEQAAVRA